MMLEKEWGRYTEGEEKVRDPIVNKIIANRFSIQNLYRKIARKALDAFLYTEKLDCR
mgnify:CR=1 FL=1